MRRLLQSFVLPALFVLCAHVALAQKVISGRVTDNQGNGIPSVTVSVKGTNVGTSTDTSGSFRVNVPASGNTLVFSSVGYVAQEVSIGNRTEINLSLQAATGNLNEVVVIGYGTARRRDLTGSVAAVTAKDFVRGPITTPEQLIAGKVAGVQITPNSGAPGSGSRIRVRAGTSLNASNDPLIVVDGVPLDNGGISGVANPLSMINPNDIESFNILKDASAAAIYGSRAANGVILITTKKGAAGKPRVSFSTLNSVANRTGEMDVLSGDEFRALVNAKGTTAEKAMLGTANTDWQDEIFRTAFTTDNNISLSGGIKNIPVRLSLGYLNQNGILKGSNLQRNSVGLNLSPKFLDNHLSVNANGKYSLSLNKFANEGAIYSAVAFNPTVPVYSGKTEFGGYWEWLEGTSPRGVAPRNPVGLLNQRTDESDVSRFIGNVQLDYKLHFLPDLRANLNLGMDKSKGQGDVFIPATAASDFARKGVRREYEQEKENKLLEFYLNYAKELSATNRVDVIGGYSWQDWETLAPSFNDYQADGTTIFKPAGVPFQTQNTLVSFYGRMNYSLMNRYLFTFTYRRDGSSRFNEDNRWGNFPSAAFAWNVKEESFLRNSNTLSNLKLRFGWGRTGQQDIGSDYGYQPNIFYGDSAARYQFGNQFVTVARPAAFDENLKWEETESKNIGVDLGFVNNRINFSAEFYDKETDDLLAVVPAPGGTNFSNQLLTNVGSIKNQGLEFTLNLVPVRNKDFTLDVNYNLTYIIKNEITQLQLVNDPTYLGTPVGGTGFNNVQIHTVGYRPYTFFLYKQVYDKSGAPIEGLYEDRNRDGKIDDLDKYWGKNPESRVFMGFSANSTYKKFGAGFSARANYGNYMYNNVSAGLGIGQHVFTGLSYLNNPTTEILNSNFNNRQSWSDYYLENASFLRMDNAYVNYNVGRVLNNRANMRVSLNVQNVFVITKYSGLDPEQSGGIDGTVYPRPRVYALGVNLDF